MVVVLADTIQLLDKAEHQEQAAAVVVAVQLLLMVAQVVQAY